LQEFLFPLFSSTAAPKIRHGTWWAVKAYVVTPTRVER